MSYYFSLHIMEYRRFGKTGVQISTISLGGMRFVNSGKLPRRRVPADTLEQCAACVKLALDSGINCFETAYNYGNSEYAYGKALKEVLAVPREKFHILTKSSPKSADEAKRWVSEQLEALQIDKIDLYGWHGINTPAEQSIACATGGPVEALLKLKEEGVIGSVGFSTHGSPYLIKELLDTGLFQFVNLHYYYFDQSRACVVDDAAGRDMGVLIISPNDKGGQLFHPSKLLTDITSPLTPIQWNARFCLSRPGVHTLAFGMTEAPHFKEMEGIFPVSVPLSDEDEIIKQNLDGYRSEDPHTWFDGRQMADDPSGINIPEVLRMRMLWKCYNMETFADYRYNMFDQGGTWFPGDFATRKNIGKINSLKIPEGVPLKKMLLEFHKRFYRQSDHLRKNTIKWLRKNRLFPLAKWVYRLVAAR